MTTQVAAAPVDAAARPLDAFAIIVAIFLCLTWGFNQVAIKLALPDIPPLLQATVRSAGAAMIVAAWAWARGVPLFERDRTLRPGLLAGALFGAEFILIYPGLMWTTASRAVVFLYLTPFFVVLGARWLLPADRLGTSQWVGLALSFAGILLAFGVPTPAADPRQMLGDLMMVVAAMGWAATTLTIKASVLRFAPFEKTLLYQLVVSIPMLGLAAWLAGERFPSSPSTLGLASIAYQTVWVVAVTYLAWFALVKTYSASRLSAFTFLTPIFGVIFGKLVLDEPVTPAFLAALALVAFGIIMVNRR
jgi:drug/metabolite transporter (DMT)-like permease